VSGVAVFGRGGRRLEIEVTRSIDGVVFSQLKPVCDTACAIVHLFFSRPGASAGMIPASRFPPYLNASTRDHCHHPAESRKSGRSRPGGLDLGVTATEQYLDRGLQPQGTRCFWQCGSLSSAPFLRSSSTYSLKSPPKRAAGCKALARIYRRSLSCGRLDAEELGTFVYGIYRRVRIVAFQDRTFRIASSK